MSAPKTLHKAGRIPFWRDERVLSIFSQVVILALVLMLLGFLISNMLGNMRQQGMGLGFSFLNTTSGFDIGEHLIAYDRNHTYLDAYVVGLLNSILVSGLGILFATLLGIIFGIASLSTNFLVQRAAKMYIEFLRNIPLLVLLIFLYLGVFIKFPVVKQAIILPGSVLITNRGIAIPWGIPTETFDLYLRVLGVALLAALALGIGLSWYGRRTGRPPLTLLWSTLAFLGIAVVGWLLMPSSPLMTELPAVKGLRIAGGRQLSPEFMALLTGLAVYTSAFIADIVRAGIQAVSHGQVEAAHSLGLTGFQTLRLVVFPQAMRVIIPPLTSQYLNLTKNSSLAVAIGYPELFHVSGTILNQSGRAVEMIGVVMASYLTISLLTSAFMNWYNWRTRLQER